jgi:2-oxoisovalerate dehydrogenase E2 component (dihydrolipoyl transacylase)
MGVYVLKLPDVGEGIAEAEIVEWNVKPGDLISEDDVLGSVMTDKATVEIPSPVAGKIVWLAGDVGTTVAIGADLVRLEVEGIAHFPADAESAPAPAPKKAEPPPTPAPGWATAPQPSLVPARSRTGAPRSALPRPEGEKPIASPAVRRRAREMGADLRYVHGTAPAGRITHQDLDDYAHGAGAPAVAVKGGGLVADTSIEEIAVIGLRRKIAAKMQEAKRRIPHITYVEEIDVTEIEALRTHMNETRREDQPKLTLLPFLMRAIVVGLRDFPKMSAHFDDEAGIVRQYGAAHIGVAAQTPTGLVVPVVKHAEARDVWECALEVKRLADAARDGRAMREELSGSTITITSLGAMGGLATTPVINHPEVAIIGVNKIRVQPVYQNGGFVPRKIMNLSSSFDHRVIDGWDAAAFVQRIKTLLEHPAMIFTEA